MAKNRPAEVAAATDPVAREAVEAARATAYASRAGRADAAKLRPALTPGRQREAVVLRPSPSIRQGGPVPRVDAYRTTSRRSRHRERDACRPPAGAVLGWPAGREGRDVGHSPTQAL